MTGRHDFDFLHGRWAVANRGLKQRQVGSTEWVEFPGEATCRGYLGSLANVDEFTFPTRGSSGMTIRVFDIEKSTWSIYWVPGATGTLGPPVHGRFADGLGLFYGDDDDNGRAVKVVYRWYAHRQRPRWEQAYSIDSGKTWETNWIMQLTRLGD